jgi:hypothetical protein
VIVRRFQSTVSFERDCVGIGLHTITSPGSGPRGCADQSKSPMYIASMFGHELRQKDLDSRCIVITCTSAICSLEATLVVATFPQTSMCVVDSKSEEETS